MDIVLNWLPVTYTHRWMNSLTFLGETFVCNKWRFTWRFIILNFIYLFFIRNSYFELQFCPFLIFFIKNMFPYGTQVNLIWKAQYSPGWPLVHSIAEIMGGNLQAQLFNCKVSTFSKRRDMLVLVYPLNFITLFLFLIVSVCLSVSVWVPHVWKWQRTPGAGETGFCEHPTWVLRAELRSSWLLSHFSTPQPHMTLSKAT